MDKLKLGGNQGSANKKKRNRRAKSSNFIENDHMKGPNFKVVDKTSESSTQASNMCSRVQNEQSKDNKLAPAEESTINPNLSESQYTLKHKKRKSKKKKSPIRTVTDKEEVSMLSADGDIQLSKKNGFGINLDSSGQASEEKIVVSGLEAIKTAKTKVYDHQTLVKAENLLKSTELADSLTGTLKSSIMSTHEALKEESWAPCTGAGKQQRLDSRASNEEGQKTKAQLKAERKAAFEAKRVAEVADKRMSDKQTQQKSKATLRAERRAVQEAQRAAKEGKHQLENVCPVASVKMQEVFLKQDHKEGMKDAEQGAEFSVSKNEKSAGVKKVHKKTSDDPRVSQQEVRKKVRLFRHLPQYHHNYLLTRNLRLAGSDLHPSIIGLGLQISQGVVRGSNARCVALLTALKEIIQDYITPPHKELSRDLEAKIRNYMNFLNQCRPVAVSMANAVKHLTRFITKMPSNINDSEAKLRLCEQIDTFIKEEIKLAKQAISQNAGENIRNHDVVLTYTCSSSVKGALCDAYDEGKNFRVVVVDARPRLDGREMLRCLVKKGIQCSYVLINAVPYIMQEVTKVMLGAHSLQANGYVMSRVGCSQIALIARAYNVPVLVCCETYKFSEHVHTDSIVYNELADPNELVTELPPNKQTLENWQDIPSLYLLNLEYDLTPPDLVAMVITDIGNLPCTSVPVVLRVKHAGSQEV
ncbi:translation initiation factor eIF-2B subunit delta-like isoform X2 [Limulus polyphemus]|uniref:Translation initiation factor eIF2B subunit delta n=1 Tax=Limulus polyphemus TaxID=6850 RepID=A0ABM1BR06_LIMPO|nr:translation initiation factor eIF-2B subunit delta-like isoform X2 [Limulus polyphemus]